MHLEKGIITSLLVLGLTKLCVGQFCQRQGCGQVGSIFQDGSCGSKLVDAWICDDSPNLCVPTSSASSKCYCCVDKCRNVGCESQGGKCYTEEQEGMECRRSDNLCRSIPKPGGTKDTVPCWCCKKEPEPVEPVKCKDMGCGQLWQGQGECVNVTSVNWDGLEAQYDLRYTNRYYNKRCVAPDYAATDKDCCLCMKKRPCQDTGCFQAGGMCVDLKSSSLNPNTYPRNVVDLGDKIVGTVDLCRSQQGSSTTAQGRKCCECFRRKTGDNSNTSGGTA